MNHKNGLTAVLYTLAIGGAIAGSFALIALSVHLIGGWTFLWVFGLFLAMIYLAFATD